MSGETYDDIAGSKATLPVPDVSLRLFRDRCPEAAGMDDAEVMDLIEAVAAPMVAQELRRLADEQEQVVKRHGPSDASWWGVLALAGAMRARADELETAVQDTTRGDQQ